MDRLEKRYNTKHRPDWQYNFLLQPKSELCLFGWKAEHHDTFTVRQFISFQGKVIDYKIPYNAQKKPYVTFLMGSLVHFMTKSGDLREFRCVRDIYVEIIPDPHITEPWNAYKDGIYVVNTLNPTPIHIEKLLKHPIYGTRA